MKGDLSCASVFHLQNHGKLSSFLGLFEVLLSLPELGKVKSCNFLSLFNLLLVSLYFSLKLACKISHAVLVLLVLSKSKSKLLGLALSPLVSLGSFTSTALSGCKFSLELLDLHLHLGHGSLSTLQSSVLSISKTTLKLSELVDHGVLGASQSSSVILFSAEFISKTSSIDHSLLGLVLSILSGYKHTIDFSLHGVDGGFELTLGGHVTAIDGLQVVDGSTGISNISLDLPLSSLGSIKESLALFNFTGEGSSFALRDADLLSDLSLGSGFILEKLDGFLQLGLVPLDGLQSLSIGFVGMIQSNFKLIDFSLELLLNTKSFSLGTLFSFNGSSKRVHCTGMILSGIVELIFSLSNTSINVLPM